MNLRRPLLAVSLVANVALLVLLAREPGTPAAPDGEAVGMPEDQTVTATTTGAAEHPATNRDASPPPQAPLWSRLPTSDLRVLMTRLADAGFPPAIVKAIIAERIDAQRDETFLAVLGDEHELPYWQPRMARYTPEVRATLFRQTEEEFALRHDLELFSIAHDPAERERALHTCARELGVTDPEKAMRLFALQNDYLRIRLRDHVENLGPAGRQSGRATSALIQQELQADIRALLSPEEFAEYELRQSKTAAGLRSALARFRPTEEEYRALYAVYRATEPVSTSTTEPAELVERRREQARAVLSPERFADYQQAIAPNAGRLNRLMGRFGLPLSAGAPVTGIRQDTERRADALRQNAALSPEQRSALLRDLALDTMEKIHAALGPRVFATYSEYDGDWIRALPHRP